MGTGYTYEYMQSENTVVIYNLEHFNPIHTFLCGQCFRWEEQEDGSFTGVAYGKVVNIRAEGKSLYISNCTEEDFINIWQGYLGLDTDYGVIKNALMGDEHLEKAMDFGWGIHLLNQEPFECLVSFVISTQNQIPRIKKIVKALSESFGNCISFGGKDYYTFPSCEKLASLSLDDLSHINAGYRGPYILDAAKKVASGEIDLMKIASLSTIDARKELMKIKGVGPKVADCTMLFSLKKTDAFPIDVWVQKAVRELYLGQGATLNQIGSFAREKFGEFGGVAQQYLFYYARENSLFK